MNYFLQAKKLVKSYGRRRVVDEVSLEVKQGEIVGLLGPNGAGKTTTFAILAGLISPDEGKIFLKGEDISSWPMYLRARAGLGFLPQEPSVFLGLTVEENILAVQQQVVNEKKPKADLNQLLKKFGLKNLSRVKAAYLSGGERRRLELARAMAVRPDFLLLDEPFTGIDPLGVMELKEHFQELKKEGLGLLITDHNVRETLKITDWAAIIDRGQILESGPPQKIIDSSEVRKRYLGEDFRLT
ncbi:MAG: LPS export ABC transporter ATP-binding protein [Candidatus Aminicenantes bacterium]|nr:LPS export ABC transporter ATP-binding protein [Candidatus Aminicenantes bacterium]